MVASETANTISFSSTKIQMISRVQYLPLVKQENFLRAKYEGEELSPREIANLTFSSRSTIVKYLETHGMVLHCVRRIDSAEPFPSANAGNKGKSLLMPANKVLSTKPRSCETKACRLRKL
jgi:hypothetical protein